MGLITDWSVYTNFTKEEFDCKETGENKMDSEFLDKLQAIRTEFGKPIKITSGYRSKKHSVEIKKKTIGAHPLGRAADIPANGNDSFILIGLAIKYGMTGIGVSQKGKKRFLHLDDITGNKAFPRPNVWSY